MIRLLVLGLFGLSIASAQKPDFLQERYRIRPDQLTGIFRDATANGEWLLTEGASNSSERALWRLPKGEIEEVFDSNNVARFSPNGMWLAFKDRQTRIRFLNLSTMRLQSISPPLGTRNPIQFSRDSSRLWTRFEQGYAWIDVASGILTPVSLPFTDFIASDLDGRFHARRTQLPTIRARLQVYDRSSNLVSVDAEIGGTVNDVAFSRDGATVWALGRYDQVSFLYGFASASGQPIAAHRLTLQSPTLIGITPNGQAIFTVSGPGDATIVSVSLTTGQVVATYHRPPNNPSAMTRLVGDGSKAIVELRPAGWPFWTGKLDSIDLATMQTEQTLGEALWQPLQAGLRGKAMWERRRVFNPSTLEVANTLVLYDANGSEERSFDLGEQFQSLNISLDGTVATVSYSDRTEIRRVADWTLSLTLSPVVFRTISRDGALGVTTSQLPPRIIDLRTGVDRSTVDRPIGPTFREFSFDNSLLYVWFNVDEGGNVVGETRPGAHLWAFATDTGTRSWAIYEPGRRGSGCPLPGSEGFMLHTTAPGTLSNLKFYDANGALIRQSALGVWPAALYHASPDGRFLSLSGSSGNIFPIPGDAWRSIRTYDLMPVSAARYLDDVYQGRTYVPSHDHKSLLHSTPFDHRVYRNPFGPGDVDMSGCVDANDLELALRYLGTFNPKIDLNGDGWVTTEDIAIVLDNMDDDCD